MLILYCTIVSLESPNLAWAKGTHVLFDHFSLLVGHLIYDLCVVRWWPQNKKTVELWVSVLCSKDWNYSCPLSLCEFMATIRTYNQTFIGCCALSLLMPVKDWSCSFITQKSRINDYIWSIYPIDAVSLIGNIYTYASTTFIGPYLLWKNPTRTHSKRNHTRRHLKSMVLLSLSWVPSLNWSIQQIVTLHKIKTKANLIAQSLATICQKLHIVNTIIYLGIEYTFCTTPFSRHQKVGPCNHTTNQTNM